MRSTLQSESSVWGQYAAALLLFLLLACVVIGKALLLHNCMAFDSTDDLNHTFTGLNMANKLLRSGVMPYFNYYNNFGTPLMGDALTYPFAIQALPYYFTDFNHYPLVSTLNRFVLCFATLTALLVFYRTFSLSIFASAMAAICVFFNFGFYWHFAHHHYQATLLFAVCILTFQRIAIRNSNHKQLFITVALLSGLMIYSVSANLILLCFVFFALHPFFYRTPPKTLVINAAALFSGGLLGGIQIITSAMALFNSARSHQSYVDAFDINFTSFDLLLRTLFQYRPAGSFNGHIYLVVYFPMFITLAYAIGLYLLFKEQHKRSLALSVALGLFPMLLTGLLLVNTWLWQALPLLKSTDITRLLWIAMIFIGIGIGTFTDALLSRALNKPLAWLIATAMTAAAYVCTMLVFSGKSYGLYALGYWAALALTLAYLLQIHLSSAAARPTIVTYMASKWPYIAGTLVLVVIILTYGPIVHYLGNWGSPGTCRSANYFSETPAVNPDLGWKMGMLSESGRFALDTTSSGGLELISETFGRHGAGGRSIAMDAKLQALLLAKGLIQNDDLLSGYHFTKPWDTSMANSLGLRYFGTPKPEFHDNWQFAYKWGDFFVYENTLKPSIIYLQSERTRISFIDSFSITGNDLLIDLPKSSNGGRLHVTITARPGFSVYVDGKKQTFGVDIFGFMYVDITPANRIMRVSYNPLNLSGLF